MPGINSRFCKQENISTADSWHDQMETVWHSLFEILKDVFVAGYRRVQAHRFMGPAMNGTIL